MQEVNGVKSTFFYSCSNFTMTQKSDQFQTTCTTPHCSCGKTRAEYWKLRLVMSNKSQRQHVINHIFMWTEHRTWDNSMSPAFTLMYKTLKFRLIWEKDKVSIHQRFTRILKLGEVSQTIRLVNLPSTCTNKKQNFLSDTINPGLTYGRNVSSST